jgi:glycosyltransferase involved in cell wall biosynthesis
MTPDAPAPNRALLISHGAAFDGGAELAFDELVASISKYAPSLALLVVVPRDGVIAQRARLHGADVTVVAQPRWADFGEPTVWDWIKRFIQGVVSLGRMVRLIVKRKPQVVITNTMTIPIGPLAVKLCQVRVLWKINEFGNRDHHLSFVLGYRRTVAMIGRLSDVVMCCSLAVRDELKERGVPESRLKVVYGAVDTPSDEPTKVRHAGDQLTVLLVGRISKSEGLLLAVRALGLAIRSGADVMLRLVGAPYEREYVDRVHAAVDEAALGDRVTFEGALDDPFPAYRGADVVLMCSKDEAFGRVTVEAMKLGLPVIGVDSGGTKELIEDGVTGFLTPPGDAAAMGRAHVDLWTDEEKRGQMGRRARKSAMSRFTAAGWVEQILALAMTN